MKLKEVVTYVLIIALLCLLFKKNMYEGNSNIISPLNELLGSVNRKKQKKLVTYYR